MQNIIEPCCAERQLPALLREQKGRAVLFQTYGDVTFDNILRSISCMAGNDRLTMTLAVKEVTPKMQRTIQRYQDRGWVTEVRLLIGETQGEAICFEGEAGAVAIQGPVIDTSLQKGTLMLYTGQYSRDTQQVSLVAMLASRYRLHAENATAEKKQKKTKTNKTKKTNEKSTESVARKAQTEESTEATA